MTRVAVLLLILVANVARSQEPAAGPDPIGVREPARFLDEYPRQVPVGAAAVQANQFVLVPSYSAAAGASLYGATLAFINRSWVGVPIQLRVGDRVMDVGPANRNRFSVDGKVSLAPKEAIWKAAVGALYQNTTDVATRQDFSVALESRLSASCAANCVTAGVTASAVQQAPAGGSRSSGGVVAASTTVRLGNTTELEPAYRFRSDVLGGEDYSFTVRQSLVTVQGSPTLGLSIGRGRAVAIVAILVF